MGDKAVSPLIATIVAIPIVILLGITILTVSLDIAGDIEREQPSRAGIKITDNDETGVINVLITDKGNAEKIVMDGSRFDYTFNKSGQSLEFAAQNISFTSYLNGKRTFLTNYNPPVDVREDVKLPGDFKAVYVPKDGTNSSLSFEISNPFAKEVKIEAIKIDAVPKKTTLSHAENTEDSRPSSCPTPENKDLCTLVQIDSKDDGYVTSNYSSNFPLYIGNESRFEDDEYKKKKNKGGGRKGGRGKKGGNVKVADWNEATVDEGGIFNFTAYRFQYSSSGKQVSDVKNDIFYVTFYFSNGESYTFQEKV